MTPDITFAIPGDLQTLTGGYGYDRRLIAGLQALGLNVAHMPLSGTFPTPHATALADAEARFAALPDGAIVVAEGIEDAKTMGRLRALGCDEGQGYHIAQPMEREALQAWLLREAVAQAGAAHAVAA